MRLFQKGHATVRSFTLHTCYLIVQQKNLGSNYTTAVSLVLHESFVSKMGPKFNCLVDFCITSLPAMRAYMHAHCCLLFKAGCEIDLVIDRFS